MPWDLDALIVGWVPEGVCSRFRLTSVKTRVKVSWIYALCDVGFLPSSGSVRPGVVFVE